MTPADTALSKLLPYIRILILDDNRHLANGTLLSLNQHGYKNVEIATDPQAALDRLPFHNIVLSDLLLGMPGWDGLRVCREAKKMFKDKIEVILYSADESKLETAVESGAIAFFRKPLQFDYLKIWIDEIAKRIWLEKILGAIPDEIAVIDVEDFGLVHYVNETKKKAFQAYDPLVGKYCFDCFEEKDYAGPCRGCSSKLAAERETAFRREWNFISTIDKKKHSVDLHVAPLYDENRKNVAVVEAVRDRTDRMHMQQILSEIGHQQDWQKRLDMFLNGFLKLGFERIRFYERLQVEGKDCFRGVKALGMPASFNIKAFTYKVDSDKPTKLLLKKRMPLLFRVDDADRNMLPIRSRTFEFLYKVGENFVQNNNILQKKRWAEIPLIANGKIIAKVSADPRDGCFLWSYHIETLNYYATNAGQAIYNAQQRAKLNEKTQKAIIKIARRISRFVSTKEILKEAVRRICYAMDVAHCSIFLLEETEDITVLKRQTSYFIAKDGKRGHSLGFDESYSLGSGSLTGRVFEQQQDGYFNHLADIIADEKFQKTHGVINFEITQYLAMLLQEPLYNAMFALLQTESGNIGIIRVTNKQRADSFGNKDFDDVDLTAFQALAGQLAIAIENGRMMDEMRKLQEDRVEIIENYSHTLKNRIQPLLTRAQSLYEKSHGNDERSWRALLDGFTRLRTVINTMLQLSKAEVGATQLNPTEFSLNELISSILPTYEMYLKDKELNFDAVMNHNIQVSWDRQLIYDAIANLIDNAIKYGQKQTPITIRLIAGKKRVGIAVQNQGEAILPKDRKRIFDKYYTGRNLVENEVSIGLGLPYVHLICRSHRGRIFHDHRFIDGARFVMILPYYIKQNSDRKQQEEK